MHKTKRAVSVLLYFHKLIHSHRRGGESLWEYAKVAM